MNKERHIVEATLVSISKPWQRRLKEMLELFYVLLAPYGVWNLGFYSSFFQEGSATNISWIPRFWSISDLLSKLKYKSILLYVTCGIKSGCLQMNLTSDIAEAYSQLTSWGITWRWIWTVASLVETAVWLCTCRAGRMHVCAHVCAHSHSHDAERKEKRRLRTEPEATPPGMRKETAFSGLIGEAGWEPEHGATTAKEYSW